jgi:hypothetical protein
MSTTPPPPPPPWQSTGQPYAYQPPPQTSGTAITSLVLGIVGIIFCPLVASIPAIVLGRSAMKEIDASEGRIGGRGLAQGGFITGIIGTVLGTVATLAVLAVFLIGGVIIHDHSSCTAQTSDGTFTTC